MIPNSDKPIARYAIGGDPRYQDGPKVFATTLLKGDTKLALVNPNPYNADAANLTQKEYLPTVALRIKELRGWEYGTYDLVISTPTGGGERVKWGKDPDTHTPTFGDVNVYIPEEDLDRMVRSLHPAPGLDHFYDADLSQYHMLDSSLDPG